MVNQNIGQEENNTELAKEASSLKGDLIRICLGVTVFSPLSNITPFLLAKLSGNMPSLAGEKVLKISLWYVPMSVYFSIIMIYSVIV